MPKFDNISVRVCRETFKTPIKTDAGPVHGSKPRIFLPIVSKRSADYAPNFVARTTSTDSTEASLSPQNNAVTGAPAVQKDAVNGLVSSSRFMTLNEPKNRTTPPKTVSWASVSHVNVVSPEDSPSYKNDLAPKLVAFVEKLRRSPKHADTIYVYQSTPFMDFDDQDEDEYRFFSPLPHNSGIHSIPLTLCDSSN